MSGLVMNLQPFSIDQERYNSWRRVCFLVRMIPVDASNWNCSVKLDDFVLTRGDIYCNDDLLFAVLLELFAGGIFEAEF